MKQRDLTNLPKDKVKRTVLPSYLLEDMKKQFIRCLDTKYTHTDYDGDFSIEEEGNTLYLLFQWTRTGYDWISNFSFAAGPQKEMEIKWRCHRGFLRVWKAIEPYVKEKVLDRKFTKICIVGYSHGAAIATLAHEYVWFHRPDLHSEENPDGLVGYGFGCPRCYFRLPWKKMPEELKIRWKNFYPIRNLRDLVTHVPPRIFGFHHVHEVVQLGQTGKWQNIEDCPKAPPCVEMHYAPNYLMSLDDGILEAKNREE